MGAVLLQHDRPVAYATQALTVVQQNYPQIEKEAYAIHFGCKRFHEYVYGKEIIVETDHKPLEAISKKNLLAVPTRLQKILFEVMPYSPKIVYKEGTTIPIPDALSRDCVNNEPDSKDDEELTVHLVLPMLMNAQDELLNAVKEDDEYGAIVFE